MSRIGKQPITIPEGTEIEIKEDNTVIIRGKKGEIQEKVSPEILVEEKEGRLYIKPKRNENKVKALWGLWRALLQNAVLGVNNGFEKKLEIKGVGYTAALEGNKIRLEVGYSHPVYLDIPEGIEVSVQKNVISVSGINKQKVGEFAAKIRKVRPPEPYKGKGIRYFGEKIRMKEGKKAAGVGEGK